KWMVLLIGAVLVMSGVYLFMCPQSYLPFGSDNLVRKTASVYGEDSFYDEEDYNMSQPLYYNGDKNEITLGFVSPRKMKGIFLLTIGKDTVVPQRISITIDNKYYYEVEAKYDHYYSINFMDWPIGKT